MTMTMRIPDAPDADTTLDLLWERIRQRGDLPGFTKAISAVLDAMHDEEEREFNMTQTVMSDPGLTQKVLRLANSAMYSAFGQSIGTVSRAVMVLGTQAIGHLALGSRLIDELSASAPDTLSARLEMEKALLAGHVARQVASSANWHHTEEAVVCSMLHTLGRMMVAFYLPEHWSQAQQDSEKTQQHQDLVLQQMLGLSLEQLGRAIAQRWGLPDSLINSMRKVEPSALAPGEKVPHAEWLAAISSMTSQCASALCQDDASGDTEILRLAGAYAGMLGVDAFAVLQAAENAKKTAESDLGAVHSTKRSNTEKRARAQAALPQPAVPGILQQGVIDMRGISSSATPSQMMTMGLETLYQGLGFRRAVAFLRNVREAKYSARMGFGAGVSALIPQLMFNDAYQPDVFHAALASDRIIFAENAQDPKFAAKLPRWWRDSLSGATGFIIVPLTVNRQPVGFIYGDWSGTAPNAKPSPAEFIILNELRALVTQTAERRHAPASSGA
ncbi:MAG: HDOD domain-containing protein [Oxalobacteraceae bacterium]|nr:HDOD domain-containing protein [Oxalobacteraceae bacterium]